MFSRQKTPCPEKVRSLCAATRAVIKKCLDLVDEVQVHSVVSNIDRWYVELERTWGSEREKKRSRSKEGVAAALAEWSPHEEPQILAWLERALAKHSEDQSTKEPTKTKEPAPTRGGYAALPYVVIERILPLLPEAALRTYCALLRHEGYKSKKAWPGQSRLATMAGLSALAVWRAVRTLDEAGLIKSQYRRGESNMYEMTVVTSTNVEKIVTRLEAKGARKKRKGRSLSTKQINRMRRARSQSLH